jgi:hypothetical protein
VLGSRNSFAYAVEGAEKDMKKTRNRSALALVLLAAMVVVPVAKAQVKHIEMRVEGMT